MHFSTCTSLVVFVAALHVVTSAEPGFHCPRKDGGFVLVPCADHCRTNHCAPDGGVCDENYNCICGTFSTCTPPASQCTRRSSFAEFACKEDCQKNHGAVGGACDYEAKGCKCGAPSTHASPTSFRSAGAMDEVLNAMRHADSS